MKQLAFATLGLIALGMVGCSTTSGQKAVVVQSSFDNAKTVDINPHGLSCKETGVYCPMLGFRWNDTNPNSTIIRAQVMDLAGAKLNLGGGFVNISQLRFNIDGQITTLNPMGSTTNHTYDTLGGRLSVQAFEVPLSFLQTLHDSKNVKVQFVTDKGDMNDYLILNGQDTKAYNALGRFLDTYNKK